MARLMRLWLRYTLISVILIVLFYEVNKEVVRKRMIAEEINLPVISQTANSGNHEQVVAARKKLLEDICRAYKTGLKNVDLRWHILINTEHKIALCLVPKTGSTFWKRVMYKLEKVSKGRDVSHMYDVSKRQIHNVRLKRLTHFHTVQDIFRFWTNAVTIIFARDPYSRLFSAYVDKFYLPDFWSMSSCVKRLGLNVSSLQTQACGHGVTFEEFLRYVIHAEQTEKYYSPTFDDHWQPVARICHPCDMPYDIVAKQETFEEDREYVSRKFGIDSIIPEINSLSLSETHKDSINQTINSYWAGLISGDKCLTQMEFMERFWKSFQKQGYLPSWFELPTVSLSKGREPLKERFRRIVMSTYDAYKPTAETWKKRRENEMTKAYRSVPTSILEKIQQHFKPDFEMFSYDKRPANLYSYR